MGVSLLSGDLGTVSTLRLTGRLGTCSSPLSFCLCGNPGGGVSSSSKNSSLVLFTVGLLYTGGGGNE